MQTQARKHNATDTTRVHVYADSTGRIAGFFALSACSVELTGLPEAFLKGRTRLPVPSTLLGRFAVDNEFAGRGLGRYLLGKALLTALESSAMVASALVVLDLGRDATLSALKLYKDVGFLSLITQERRMILPMEDIRRMIS